MKRIVMSAVLAASFIVPTAALACEGMQQASVEPKKVTVAEVASWSKEKKKFVPVDANGKSTRESQGVIPGAVLLTSSTGYDVKELPANKADKLVFYCANESCGASKQAARKAMESGYTDVAVLPEGIAGWKKSGQATAKPNS
jgi:rhodanese-related sulfurtransferase